VHAVGLAVVAVAFALLAATWRYGLPLLDGTLLEELAYVFYAVAAALILAIAERITAWLFAHRHEA